MYKHQNNYQWFFFKLHQGQFNTQSKSESLEYGFLQTSIGNNTWAKLRTLGWGGEKKIH